MRSENQSFAEADLFTNLLIIAVVLLISGISQLRVDQSLTVPQTRQVLLAVEIPEAWRWTARATLSDRSDLTTIDAARGVEITPLNDSTVSVSDEATCSVNIATSKQHQRVSLTFTFVGADADLPKGIVVAFNFATNGARRDDELGSYFWVTLPFAGTGTPVEFSIDQQQDEVNASSDRPGLLETQGSKKALANQVAFKASISIVEQQSGRSVLVLRELKPDVAQVQQNEPVK